MTSMVAGEARDHSIGRDFYLSVGIALRAEEHDLVLHEAGVAVQIVAVVAAVFQTRWPHPECREGHVVGGQRFWLYSTHLT